MKFFEVYTKTKVEVTETYITKFLKRVKIKTYTTEHSRTDYIKTEMTAEELAQESSTKIPAIIKEYIDELGQGRYSKTGRNAEKWIQYAMICDLFWYDNRPNVNFEGEMDRTKFVFYVQPLAVKVKVKEMTAEKVLKNFSVTDCVEVVQELLW